MATQAEFLWSDAWLLAALLWAKRAEGEVPLHKLVAYGDALNHAVFNFDEIESGLARLTAAGLVAETDGLFVLVGEAVQWFEQIQPEKLSTREMLDQVAAKLSAEPYRPGRDPRNNLRYRGMSKSRYDDAVAGYQLWATHQLRKA